MAISYLPPNIAQVKHMWYFNFLYVIHLVFSSDKITWGTIFGAKRKSAGKQIQLAAF
jgi:hypothetical protein